MNSFAMIDNADSLLFSHSNSSPCVPSSLFFYRLSRHQQAQSPSHGIGGDSGSSSSGGASQDILDFALSSAAVASSTHAMNRNHDNGGNSFSVGDSGQFQGKGFLSLQRPLQFRGNDNYWCS